MVFSSFDILAKYDGHKWRKGLVYRRKVMSGILLCKKMNLGKLRLGCGSAECALSAMVREHVSAEYAFGVRCA
jgi:hypothetical protein